MKARSLVNEIKIDPAAFDRVMRETVAAMLRFALWLREHPREASALRRWAKANKRRRQHPLPLRDTGMLM